MARFYKVCVMFLIFMLATACSAANLTDPTRPDFDPHSFRFESYKSGKEATPAIETIFPVGETRKYVQSILVNDAGAKEYVMEKRANQPQLIFYKKITQTFPFVCGFSVGMNFNEQDILVKKPIVLSDCNVP